MPLCGVCVTATLFLKHRPLSISPSYLIPAGAAAAALAQSTTDAVKEHYRQMRIGQTVEFVQMMNKRFGEAAGPPMDVWEAIDRLSEFVDVSDPDVSLPNAVHLYQTSEGMRAAGEPEWMQVVGLLHDLGKILFVRGEDAIGCGMTRQWAIAGDTFVTGAPLPSALVYPEFNSLNPDASNPEYNSGTLCSPGLAPEE